MNLATGTMVGPYELLSPIGKGGMGEVYRARDTRLGRDVAIKVLPEAISQDAELLARFEREAKVLASLNHPHIATIYGVEEADSIHALVLELVEGPTLAERIAQQPIPLEEALPIARQMADAIEYAHERGIIHRDLKPANIKLSVEGHVKVLDFGLAKALKGEVTVGRSPILSNLPTLSRRHTDPGMILGTAAYMSPEQTQGKAVDKRTDIWAFGVVLFEMLTGRRLFAGETIPDTLSAVLRDRIDWNTLHADLPANLRALIRRCLDRDRRQRLRDIGEARIAIESMLAGRSANISAEEITREAPVLRRWLPWAAAAVLSAAGLLAGWSLRGPSSSALQPVARLAIPLSPAAPVALDTQRPALAISPDDKRIVYVADTGGKRQLYVREIDQTEARAVPGTEGACNPFFSPDGHWIGFFDGWVMKKAPLAGGAPVALAIVPPVTRGATWAPDDHIYFASNPNGGLAMLSARGESVGTDSSRRRHVWDDEFTIPDSSKGEYSHRWPQVLPGGQAILFTIDTGGTFDNARISVLNLKTREKKVLIEGGTCARYAGSGHLIFARAGALLAVSFDLNKLAVTGDPVTIINNVAMDQEGAANFDVNDDGTLVYVSGTLASTKRKLVWVSRGGEVQPLPAPAREYMQPTLSPNGQRLAVTIAEGSNYDIWLSDTNRGNLTRLTVHPDEDFNAVWAPNGSVVTISSESGRPGPQLVSVAVDGSGAPERLIPNAEPKYVHCPGSYAPGGQTLIFSQVDWWQDPESWRGMDLLVVDLDGDRKPRSLAETRFNEHSPIFSPDGHWLAYVSDETGRDEVYVRPYPGSGGKMQISTEGGGEPIWHPSGRELFYRDGYRMMAVTIQLSPTFAVGRPVLLFEKNFAVTHRPEVRQNYDISPDGKRMLMIQNEQETTAPKLDLVLNWFAELRRVTAASR